MMQKVESCVYQLPLNLLLEVSNINFNVIRTAEFFNHTRERFVASFSIVRWTPASIFDAIRVASAGDMVPLSGVFQGRKWVVQRCLQSRHDM